MFFERMGNFLRLQNTSGIKTKDDHSIVDKLKMTDEQSQLFLDDFGTKILPDWHTRGEVSRLALRPLLELVELYFKEKNTPAFQSKFSQELLAWASSLPEYAIDPSNATDDVHCLFGQAIQVGKKPIYLMEILLDCLERHSFDLDEKIKGIARWLCDYDASFIANVPELTEIYAELKAGPAFNIEVMRKCLTLLPVSCPRVKVGIHELLIESKSKVNVDFRTVQVLSEIYRLRWLQLLENKMPDYLALQSSDNAPWIRLAQLVCGAGWFDFLRENVKHKGNLAHFKENYYRFLMPTMQCDTDPVQLNGIANHALSHLILSHNSRYLILLDTSLAQFKISRKFYNWNTRQPRPLTDIEIKRMQFSHFKTYIPCAIETTSAEDLPILKNTIIGIKALVEGSFYTKGLVDNYEDAQMVMAGKALHLFYNFLKQLPADERERLLKQRIILGKKNKTVDEIFDHVDNDGEDRCIAGCAELLTQLLLDYDPNEHLSKELEERVVHYKMRENSRKKVYRDYDRVDANEAKRRLLILAVSLMSENFQYFLSGDPMSLWDSSNPLAGTTKSIFKLIRPMIKNNNFQHARHVYATIIESLAKPALKNSESSWFAWFRPNSVRHRWLQSVADESIFKQRHLWFEPEVLLLRLSPKAQMNLPISPSLEKFLDEIIYTYAQKQSIVLKKVRVNILFSKFLNSIDAMDQTELLALIKPQNFQGDDHTDDYKPIFINYLIRRLALVGAASAQWRMSSFFGQRPLSDKARVKNLASALEADIFSLKTKENYDLSNIIQKMAQFVCEPHEKSGMIDYVRAMTSAIEPVRAEGSKSPLPLLCSEFFSIIPNV